MSTRSPALEVGEHVGFALRRPHLPIPRARSRKPREDPREPMRVRVGGVEQPLVVHRGGERQRLPPAPAQRSRTCIPGLASARSAKLRAFVLQLDRTLDVTRSEASGGARPSGRMAIRKPTGESGVGSGLR